MSLLFFRNLLVLVFSTFATVQAVEKRPNILFLFTDDQRADTIAALGNEHIKTPFLDELVHQGTVFRQAYCMGANNAAVCIPSRAMLMAGKSLYRVHEQLKGQTTWPEKFAQAGYETFITGKWHNGPASLKQTFQSGRSIFLGGMSTSNVHETSLLDLHKDHSFSSPRPSGTYPSQLFADEAISFLREQDRRDSEKPFLAYVSFNLPHDPRVAPPEWHERANAAKPPLPQNFLPQHPFNNGELSIRDERLESWPRSEAAIRQHLADYYAAIQFIDAQVGRILKALKENGLAENTLVVFSSDHGLAIGSHGLMGKQSLYEHSMKAPLIFKGPGIPAGKTTEALCYLFDIFPTLGDFAGISSPPENEGLSLRAVMEGTQNTCREALLTGYRHFQRSVRDDRWKLIVYPQINKIQLFDLQADPSEKDDLSSQPQMNTVIQKMMEKLKTLQKQNHDELALQSEHPLPAEFDFSTVKSNASP